MNIYTLNNAHFYKYNWERLTLTQSSRQQSFESMMASADHLKREKEIVCVCVSEKERERIFLLMSTGLICLSLGGRAVSDESDGALLHWSYPTHCNELQHQSLQERAKDHAGSLSRSLSPFQGWVSYSYYSLFTDYINIYSDAEKTLCMKVNYLLLCI